MSVVPAIYELFDSRKKNSGAAKKQLTDLVVVLLLGWSILDGACKSSPFWEGIALLE
jgi:hypothetical protein